MLYSPNVTKRNDNSRDISYYHRSSRIGWLRLFIIVNNYQCKCSIITHLLFSSPPVHICMMSTLLLFSLHILHSGVSLLFPNTKLNFVTGILFGILMGNELIYKDKYGIAYPKNKSKQTFFSLVVFL